MAPLRGDSALALLSPEIVVVGGGPVGSALSLMLDRAGLQVLLVDAGGSKEKICGEGILPAGWEVVEELGLVPELPQRAPLKHLIYRHFLGPEMLTMQAPLRKPAFGVERAHLCAAFARALEQSEVRVWRNSRFRSLQWEGAAPVVTLEDPDGRAVVVRPQLLIGADGLHSRVRREAQLQSTRERAFHRWGTRVYFHTPQRFEGVEVTLGEGFESYLTPLGGDLHGLAFLWSPHRLGRPLPGEGAQWERLWARFPSSFRNRFPKADQFFGPNRAIGPLQQQVVSVLHPSGRVALVGDASGYLDALTGEGLCLGFQQARILASLVCQNNLARYPASYRQLKLRHLIVVNGLLHLLKRPWLRDRIFQALHLSPPVFEAVIGVAVEGRSPWNLINSGLPRFFRGLTLPVPRSVPEDAPSCA